MMAVFLPARTATWPIMTVLIAEAEVNASSSPMWSAMLLLSRYPHSATEAHQFPKLEVAGSNPAGDTQFQALDAPMVGGLAVNQSNHQLGSIPSRRTPTSRP